MEVKFQKPLEGCGKNFEGYWVMGKLFERLVRTAGSIRTTKTTNKKTGRVTTKMSRVKPKPVRQKRK